MLGVLICIIWIFLAIFSYQIVPHDPLAQNLAHRFKPPSLQHWFGTETLGRDIFSRVIVGSRLSLTAGILTVLIAGTVGSLFGAFAGYFGGLIDDIMMRVSEMVMKYPGLRLLRQDPWECTIAFICSANSNIPRIHRVIENMSDTYGTQLSTR